MSSHADTGAGAGDPLEEEERLRQIQKNQGVIELLRQWKAMRTSSEKRSKP